MPTPAKRSSQRTRRDSRARRDASTDRPEESSPIRPAKRRKQVDDSPREVPEEEGSSLVADSSSLNANDDTQVITRVTQYLVFPREQPVQASKEHSNSIHERNQEGVAAFAKIAGQDWTFYVTKLQVNIGRTSEPAPQYPPDYDAEDDEDFVHIDLGPSKMVSRQHAQIFFDNKDEKWTLRVKGRNGVKVNGSPWKVGYNKPLESGEVLEVGGVEMMFVLPLETNPLHIHETYLQRAGISKVEFTSPIQDSRGLRPVSGTGPSSQAGTRSALPKGQPFQQAIAPAPPDYKRPGTPPSARSRPAASQNKSPQFRDAGTMLMSPNDVNLSLDENQHIKPQYSYAQMITQAIMNTSEEKLNLSGIYNFIMDNYSYYKHQQPAGWQNSIRHNLSLNKAFEKVARSTEEPGKGMKWYILPEYREDMKRSAYRGGRGGHRGSSNPSSPNTLNYVNHGPKEMAARDHGSARKRKVSPSGSPQPRSALRDSHTTPDRSSRRLLPEEAPSTVEGSPLPRYRKGTMSASAAAAEGGPRSPTLTSSYLPEDGAPFVTPAPHRVEVKLNPPSTLQRPSQHMPTSSPAPFWKYADVGSTPMKQPASFELSPSRTMTNLPASSSPPPGPNKSPVPSPTRPARSEAKEASSATEVEEDRGFDLTKGFQSIGSYHAPVSHGLSVATAMNGNS